MISGILYASYNWILNSFPSFKKLSAMCPVNKKFLIIFKFFFIPINSEGGFKSLKSSWIQLAWWLIIFRVLLSLWSTTLTLSSISDNVQVSQVCYPLNFSYYLSMLAFFFILILCRSSHSCLISRCLITIYCFSLNLLNTLSVKHFICLIESTELIKHLGKCFFFYLFKYFKHLVFEFFAYSFLYLNVMEMCIIILSSFFLSLLPGHCNENSFFPLAYHSVFLLWIQLPH